MSRAHYYSRIYVYDHSLCMDERMCIRAASKLSIFLRTSTSRIHIGEWSLVHPTVGNDSGIHGQLGSRAIGSFRAIDQNPGSRRIDTSKYGPSDTKKGGIASRFCQPERINTCIYYIRVSKGSTISSCARIIRMYVKWLPRYHFRNT